jgi:class 3 adenylate cyclase
VTGDDVGGVAVRIARRLASLAQTREVLVSKTVRDLVLGSAITFCDRGTRVLDGVTGEWRLFGVTGI